MISCSGQKFKAESFSTMLVTSSHTIQDHWADVCSGKALDLKLGVMWFKTCPQNCVLCPFSYFTSVIPASPGIVMCKRPRWLPFVTFLIHHPSFQCYITWANDRIITQTRKEMKIHIIITYTQTHCNVKNSHISL
jgi:hypothetical protein